MDQIVERGFRDPSWLEKIVSSLTEGVIVLDECGSFAWTNEAARRVHGLEPSGELGTSYRDYVRRFEIRSPNGRGLTGEAHPMARVLAGESFRDLLVEVRKAGSGGPARIHTLRGVGLAGAGRPALIITDLTELHLAERRFESAFNANPAPSLICRLADLRYLRANAGFLEMTGLREDEVVGRSIYELDVLAGAEDRARALQRLREGRTVPRMQACIPLGGAAGRFVMVAGEPIRLREEPCMLFTFADLDPLKDAETALRQSEGRFSTLFDLSPVPQAITALKGFRITQVNRAFCDMTGYAQDEAIGHSATELVLWDEPVARRQVEGLIERAGGLDGAGLKVRAKDGSTVDCLVSAVTMMVGGEPCVLWVAQDITDRKRSEDELVAAIETVMADTSWFSRSVVEKLARLRRTTRALPISVELDELTERERDILDLICEGLSDEEMSRALKLSHNTIRNHISALYRKIGVNRRSAAIIWGRERGISGRDALHQPRLHAKRRLQPAKM